MYEKGLSIGCILKLYSLFIEFQSSSIRRIGKTVQCIRFHTLHGADIFFFFSPINKFFSCGILPGGEWLIFRQGKTSDTFCGCDNDIDVVLYRILWYGMQDVLTIEFRQGGKAAVENLSNAAIVFQIDNEQGQCRIHIATVLYLIQIVIDILLNSGHGAKHPVIVIVSI